MTIQAENLLGKSISELEQVFVNLGHKRFHGRQLFKWFYRTRQYDFSLMTDLTKELRRQLGDRYAFVLPEVETVQKSADGTEKFLFRLSDGKPVEAVLIPDGARRTVCISSQSGCALGCRFCATGTMGLLRHLTAGEIVGQLIVLRDRLGEQAFGNVVFMGMGEPLQNFDNLLTALSIMSDPLGLQVAAKKITVSTCGITPKIRKLADSGLKPRLALSLHAATQEKRRQVMPIADTFGLDKLMAAVRYYAEKIKDRVTFEYILFDGFNDTMADVVALAKLIEGIPCKINVLAYNPVRGLPFRRPSDEKVDWFGRMLQPRTPAVTVRRSRGVDIDAACGQLAARQQSQPAEGI